MSAFAFKEASRSPAGASADGVMAEHDLIETRYGKATIERSTVAVLSEPELFPNLLLFDRSGGDLEKAREIVVADGIRHAYSAVIPFYPKDAGAAAHQVRVLHVVPDEDGDLVYRTVECIKENKGQTKYLLEQLRRDAETFSRKLDDLVALLIELA